MISSLFHAPARRSAGGLLRALLSRLLPSPAAWRVRQELMAMPEKISSDR